MKSLLAQYKRSLEWELGRLGGYSLEYAGRLDSPLLEVEGDTFTITTPSHTFRYNIYTATTALQGLKTQSLTPSELIAALERG